MRGKFGVRHASTATLLYVAGVEMRIYKVHIKNLRSFEDETVHFDAYTALVGANGAGKSTVLCALNIFFRETDNASTNMSELDAEDFHLRDIEKPIEITVTFTGLSEAAQKTFAEYYRHGELVVSAVAEFNLQTGTASVRQFGQRRAMAAFGEFFKQAGNGATAEPLKLIYNQLRGAFPGLPVGGAKAANIAALRAFEEGHPELCELIPSEDQFYGFSKGSNRLAEYVQWVYVPAVKDAAKEQIEARNTALGRLLARTVRAKVNFESDIKALRDETQVRYQALLEAQQGVLTDLSSSLQARLGEWAHPEATVKLEWQQDPKKSVQVEEPLARLFAGEGDFVGELARFGHGLQRSYLLALLQELAAVEMAEAPVLILGIEEPELYQHPPQARHLSGVLQSLSENNAQIMVSTHSPQFVSGRGFEAVRLVRRIRLERKSVVQQVSAQAIADAVTAARGQPPMPSLAGLARLNQALQPSLNEMFFTSRLILVEGLEDVAFITSWMVLGGYWEEFRRNGCHLVPANGKSEIVQPLVVAQKLGIPTFVVFDADGADQNVNRRALHEADNRALLGLAGGDPAVPFPAQIVWTPNLVVWPNTLGDVMAHDIGQARWDQLHTETNGQFGNPKSFGKNAMHIGTRLALAHAAGDNPVSLDTLCQCIVQFAAT
jgi:putative ATP-dependent endonuclease of the OLD family